MITKTNNKKNKNIYLYVNSLHFGQYMSFTDALKLFRSVENAIYRIEKLEERLKKLEKEVAQNTKNNNYQIEREAILDRKRIKVAREIQHKLIKEVYDRLLDKVSRLSPLETNIDVGLQLQTQSITYYYNIMERTHLEEGTHPKLIESIIVAMKPAIMYIIDAYGEEYVRLFKNSGEERTNILKQATNLYCKELCLKFDEELYDYIENVENF